MPKSKVADAIPFLVPRPRIRTLFSRFEEPAGWLPEGLLV